MVRAEHRWVMVGFALIAAIHLWSRLDPPMPPIHGDGYYTYLWARSLVFDGDWDLTNDYALCGDPWHMRTRLGEPEPGMRPHNPWSPGPSLIWAPFLLAARLTFDAAGSDDPKVARACQGPMSEFAMLGTVLAGLLAVWLAYRFSRRYVSQGAAFLGAAGVALATSLPYYSTLLPSYNHALAAFAVALALERWDAARGSRRWLRWVTLGAMVGLAMLMRAQDALVALAPLFEWLLLARADVRARDWRRLARLVGVGLLFTAASLLVFSPQLYLWKLTYGTYVAVPQGEYFMRWSTPHLAGVFWASTGGLLVWTPILYGAFVGLFSGALRRDRRFVAVALLAVVAAFTYVNASAYDYFGSASFSNRRFTALALPFAFGLALCAEGILRFASRRPRAFASAALVLAITAFTSWNYAAMWGHATGRIQSARERPMKVFWGQIFDRLSVGVYDAVGDPLAWPASIPFALRYHTHPRRWDVMRGMGVFYENEQTREPRTSRGENEARFAREHQLDYAVEGFEDGWRSVDGRDAVVTTGERARMLIPFFWDDVSAVEVRWKALRTAGRSEAAPTTAALSWNGVPITSADVGYRWHTTRIDLPPGVVEIDVNELRWQIVGGPIAFEAIRALQIPRDHHPARVR